MPAGHLEEWGREPAQGGSTESPPNVQRPHIPWILTEGFLLLVCSLILQLMRPVDDIDESRPEAWGQQLLPALTFFFPVLTFIVDFSNMTKLMSPK